MDMKYQRHFLLFLMIGFMSLTLWGCSKNEPDANSPKSKSDQTCKTENILSEFKSGITLPTQTTELMFWPKWSFDYKNGGRIEQNNYAVLSITENDFLVLADQLELKVTDDIFDFWPDVFTLDDKDEFLTFPPWQIEPQPTGDIYWGESDTLLIEIAMCFMDDRLYLRTFAIEMPIVDDKGIMIDSKILERQQ